MRMAVEVPRAMDRCRPGAHCVVMEDDALATLFDFGVVGGVLVPGEVAQGLPDVSGMVQIVVAQDQPLTALQSVENLTRATDIVAAKVTQVPDDILRFYDRIPGVNDELIHLIRGNERAKAQHQLMAKMRVTGEVMLGKRHNEGPFETR